jgi:subtilisin family serine protease
VTDAVAALRRDPRVEYAEPDYYSQGLSNDPLYSNQWALPAIHAPEAWTRTTGSPGVKVAVIDSGMTWGQPDLAPSLWRNPGETGGGKESNGKDDDGDGYVDDWRGWDFVQGDNDPTDNHGHGTAVASTIAARGNNGIGISGVAGNTTIVPIRVLDNDKSGRCSQIAAGIAYAAKIGAQVANVSIGSHNTCQAERDAIAAAPNVLFAIGSGNDGESEADYPCAYDLPNIICVGATDQSDAAAAYSNFDPQTVDLAAPGTHMLGAWPLPGPKYSIFKDGFETPIPGRWLPGAPNTWDRTTSGARTGSYALTDSPKGNYADNTDSYVYLMQELDLRGMRGCFANVWINSKIDPDLGTGRALGDALIAEASVDGVDWGERPDAFFGVSGGYELWQIDLSELEGRDNPPMRFRFDLLSDVSGNSDGVYLDDFEVACWPPLENYTGAANEFDYDTGTSYSAPLVAGVAALMLSLDPNLTTADLKARILSSVDPLPSLAGKTVTGGRLDAAKAIATIPPSPPAAPATSPLAADLTALVKKLRIRTLLRGPVGVSVHAPAAGRLTLVVKSGKRTIAGGSRTASRAGRYSLRLELTRRGRALLRHSRHPSVTVALTFTPRSGPALAQSTRLRLPR